MHLEADLTKGTHSERKADQTFGALHYTRCERERQEAQHVTQSIQQDQRVPVEVISMLTAVHLDHQSDFSPQL